MLTTLFSVRDQSNSSYDTFVIFEQSDSFCLLLPPPPTHTHNPCVYHSLSRSLPYLPSLSLALYLSSLRSSPSLSNFLLFIFLPLSLLFPSLSHPLSLYTPPLPLLCLRSLFTFSLLSLSLFTFSVLSLSLFTFSLPSLYLKPLFTRRHSAPSVVVTILFIVELKTCRSGSTLPTQCPAVRIIHLLHQNSCDFKTSI